MNKIKYVIGILLLFMVIGFATVTVTLSINGNAKILSDLDQFKVYFSDVKLNGSQDLSLVKSETKLEFELEMSTIGTNEIIKYDVTNASTMFDANITISCTDGDEYLSVINEFDTSNLLASTTRTGILTLKKLKSNASELDKNYMITCNIIASPVERTEEATGEVPPLESLIAMSDQEVIFGGVSASPWITFASETLETVSSTNTLFKPSFLNDVSSVIPKASLLVSYDSTGGTSFDVGDQIKVQNITCYTNENDNAMNFINVDDIWKYEDESDAVYWCEEGTVSEIVATYPVTSSYDYFTIPEDQSTHARFAASDWMTASHIGTLSYDPINFSLKHMLSKVTFNISLNEQFEEGAMLDSFKVYSLGSKLIRESNGEVAVEKIEPYGISAYKENEYTFIAYISPGEYKSYDTFISVNVEGEEFEVFVPEDIKMESGNHYTFDLIVGSEVVKISNVLVEPWTDYSIDGGSAQRLAYIEDGYLVGDEDENTDISLFITGGTSDKYNADNVKWTHDGTEWFSDTTTIIEKDNFNQKIYAFSPYLDEITNSEVSINIYDQVDFLYSKPTNINSSGFDLLMRHLLSKIVVKLTFSDETLSLNATVSNIQIKNMYSDAKFNISDGTFNSLSTSNATIDLINNEALLIPIETSEITLVVTFDSGITKEITVNTPNGLQQGMYYEISIEV